ncbi:MAG: BolA family protein [Pseudobdellovibrionaceae bacterium]
MTGRKERIEAILQEMLQPTHLEVVNETAAHHGHAGDDGSGESHFCVIVAAPMFEGKTRVERHRMINEALAGLFAEGLHALRIVTK